MQGIQVFVLLKKDVIFIGDCIIDVLVGFDEYQCLLVNICFDLVGGCVVCMVLCDNIGKLMVMVLFEKGKGEVLMVVMIQFEFGDCFQIMGQLMLQVVVDFVLLLCVGLFVVLMDIIEECMIGLSFGVDNIKMGVYLVIWGFCVIVVFMIVYYMLFGVVLVIGLLVNLLLFVVVLLLMQVMLMLLGIVVIVFVFGMVIDLNVLINECVCEELCVGQLLQFVIQVGYVYVWVMIFDLNVMMLIVGFVLFVFGLGLVCVFVIVYCFGILMLMFFVVFFLCGIVNFWYGGCKKLKLFVIGQVWKLEGVVVVVLFIDVDELIDIVCVVKFVVLVKGNVLCVGKLQLCNCVQ